MYSDAPVSYKSNSTSNSTVSHHSYLQTNVQNCVAESEDLDETKIPEGATRKPDHAYEEIKTNESI